jgi:hypothetical protein
MDELDLEGVEEALHRSIVVSPEPSGSGITADSRALVYW